MSERISSARLLILPVAIFPLAAAAPAVLHRRAAAAEAPAAAPAKPRYHCPMHPTYTSDRPGTCPICGMDLVPIAMEQEKPEAASPGTAGRAAVTLNAERRQLIGVRTGLVERKRVSRTIRAVGRVEYDERTLSAVSLKFGGWVEELMVKAVGDPVRKGEPLLALYSPEMLEAERNYLAARAAADSLGPAPSADARSLIEDSLRSARERLLLWDFSEAQLKEIEAQGRPERRVTIFSKADGVVTARNVTAGSYVEPGKTLYELADLSRVWMIADIYEYEIPLVKPGCKATAEFSADPQAARDGIVTFIYPTLDDATRTLRVRMEFPNADGRLKPGMYATVLLAADLGEQLVVDDDAVLDTGARQIVFVDLGEGRLDPREVTVGQRADGQAVILKGLSEGERVVTSGNFLVDSESRMKAALKQWTPPAGQEAAPPAKPGAEKKGATEGMPGMPGMPGM